jgi:hypothetical protein
MEGLNYLYGKNPHSERASMLTRMAYSQPDDKYGYAAWSRIPAMAMAGHEMAQAEKWDQTRGEEVKKASADQKREEARNRTIQTVINIAGSPALDPNGKRNTIKSLIEGRKDELGLDPDVYVGLVEDGPEYTNIGLQKKKDGGQLLLAIQKQSGAPFVFDKGQWRDMTDEDLSLLGEMPKPEGRKRLDRETHLGGGNWQKEESYDEGVKWSPVGKPYKKEGGGGGSLTEKDAVSEFRQHVSDLDSLNKAKALILKGVDPLTGAYIPQTQIADALKVIDPQILQLEGYIKKTFPEQWYRYKPAAPAAPAAGPGRPTPQQAMEELRRRGLLK